METQIEIRPDDLVARFEEARASKRVRARDFAAGAGCSEAELVAAHVGRTATRLDDAFLAMFAGLEPCGTMTGITRNEHIVLERQGIYRHVSAQEAHGQVVDEGMDLRLFLWRFASAFAVREETKNGLRRSIQFFDKAGVAAHKGYLFEPSGPRADAFDALVGKHRAEIQARTLEVGKPEPRPAERPDSEIDVEGLREGLRGMQDTHEFFFLLRKYGASRMQALRLLGDEWARPVSTSSFERALGLASERNVKIMLFVGNSACIQIHSGHIDRVVRAHGWLNVLDAEVNVHARDEAIASAWIVRKPTRDGIVTSLELMSASGENLGLMFGKRKPGQDESPEWRSLIDALA